MRTAKKDSPKSTLNNGYTKGILKMENECESCDHAREDHLKVWNNPCQVENCTCGET